jgi:hypothetical protein
MRLRAGLFTAIVGLGATPTNSFEGFVRSSTDVEGQLSRVTLG